MKTHQSFNAAYRFGTSLLHLESLPDLQAGSRVRGHMHGSEQVLQRARQLAAPNCTI